MKYLGADIGEKRVGIAVSDDGGTVAFPLSVVSRSECVASITALIAERRIGTVVIGASYALDGSDNPVMAHIRDIADALHGVAEVVLHPEQFSTREAARIGRGSDAEAATIILQSYLDRLRERDDDIMFE